MKQKLQYRSTLRLGLVFLLASAQISAWAAEPSAAAPKSSFMQFLEQDYLLGTWGGLRTNLSNHGVDFEFFYIASNPRNLSGGIKTGSTYEGALLMLLDLDSRKLAGYEGGHLHVGGVWIHGEDHFSDEHIGDLNKVNLIDFPHAWRLWELWYEQKFWHDKVSFKVGQLAVDQDFLMAEFYNSLASINLLNQTFFYPTLAFNVYNIPGFPGPLHALASSPYGAPGVRLKVNATEELYLQAGAYDGYPDQTDGTRVRLSADEGALRTFDGEMFHLVAAHGDPNDAERLRQLGPIPARGFFEPIARGGAVRIAIALQRRRCCGMVEPSLPASRQVPRKDRQFGIRAPTCPSPPGSPTARGRSTSTARRPAPRSGC